MYTLWPVGVILLSTLCIASSDSLSGENDSKSVVNAGRGTITLIIRAVRSMLIIRDGRAMASNTVANLALPSGCPMCESQTGSSFNLGHCRPPDGDKHRKALKRGPRFGYLSMSIKILMNEGRELRLRITGETHTTLQLFRSRLNESPNVEYANFFQKHPDLDEPELYVRAVKGKKAEKVFRDLCSGISKEFSGLKL